MTRCIGLLGGVGVGAAAHYYAKLHEAHAARGMTLDLVMAHADMERVPPAIEAGDRAGLAKYFNGLIVRMQAAGAEVAVIPSVTSHYPLSELREISPLPLIDIFEPLRREVARRGIRRVGAFGTRFAVESELYGRVPELEIVQARPEEVDYVHATYMALARRGRGTPEDLRGLTELGLELCRRENLDAILLAGTELALVFDETNTEFPALCCARLHIAAVMEEVDARSGVGGVLHSHS